MTCKLCIQCVVNCYCPHCPKNPDRLCSVDTCQCSYETILTQHYACGSEMFCQICVETTTGVKFSRQLLGMYCDEHLEAAVTRLRKEMKRCTNENA